MFRKKLLRDAARGEMFHWHTDPLIVHYYSEVLRKLFGQRVPQHAIGMLARSYAEAHFRQGLERANTTVSDIESLNVCIDAPKDAGRITVPQPVWIELVSSDKSIPYDGILVNPIRVGDQLNDIRIPKMAEHLVITKLSYDDRFEASFIQFLNDFIYLDRISGLGTEEEFFVASLYGERLEDYQERRQRDTRVQRGLLTLLLSKDAIRLVPGVN